MGDGGIANFRAPDVGPSQRLVVERIDRGQHGARKENLVLGVREPKSAIHAIRGRQVVLRYENVAPRLESKLLRRVGGGIIKARRNDTGRADIAYDLDIPDRQIAPRVVRYRRGLLTFVILMTVKLARKCVGGTPTRLSDYCQSSGSEKVSSGLHKGLSTKENHAGCHAPSLNVSAETIARTAMGTITEDVEEVRFATDNPLISSSARLFSAWGCPIPPLRTQLEPRGRETCGGRY